MLEEARRLGMDALVEAHDEVEVRRAVALGAPIIGINNRDLRSLTVDLGVTERLASLVPSDRILVAESGIETRQDVDRLAPHADAFLVGSSLMRAANPALAARALAYGRVKLCGLTDAHYAEMAASQGASYAGMVLVPNTPRAVTLQTAEPIAQAAQGEGIATVGVFRDAKMPDVAEAARVLALDAVQLHGSEDTGYIDGLRDMLPSGTEIWAAAPVGHVVPPARASADRTLFDTAVNGRSGGTGRAFDWDLLRGHEALQNGFLAGGLGPDNAARAARVGAYGLDVSSGVEMAPGRKDAGKIGMLFNALRPAVRKELQSC
jgi:indole-3-glycerol phosphate synthase/phosphoribosylanthranilate isomerase